MSGRVLNSVAIHRDFTVLFAFICVEILSEMEKDVRYDV